MCVCVCVCTRARVHVCACMPVFVHMCAHICARTQVSVQPQPGKDPDNVSVDDGSWLTEGYGCNRARGVWSDAVDFE